MNVSLPHSTIYVIVRSLNPNDCGDSSRIGHRGRVSGYETSDCGATTTDPLWQVTFVDGSSDMFWNEELEVSA